MPVVFSFEVVEAAFLAIGWGYSGLKHVCHQGPYAAEPLATRAGHASTRYDSLHSDTKARTKETPTMKFLSVTVLTIVSSTVLLGMPGCSTAPSSEGGKQALT